MAKLDLFGRVEALATCCAHRNRILHALELVLEARVVVDERGSEVLNQVVQVLVLLRVLGLADDHGLLFGGDAQVLVDLVEHDAGVGERLLDSLPDCAFLESLHFGGRQGLALASGVEGRLRIGVAGLETVGTVEDDLVELELVDYLLLDVGLSRGLGAFLCDYQFVVEEQHLLEVQRGQQGGVGFGCTHKEFLGNCAVIRVSAVVNLVVAV